MSHKGRCFRAGRRTKARKKRQLAAHRALEAAKRRKFGYSDRQKYMPDFTTGPHMAIAAATLLAPDMLRRRG